MPASDLRALRKYVANVLDYDPDNPTYKRQIDRFLNEADRIICSEKPFTFVNRALEVTVRKDVSTTAAFASGAPRIFTTSGAFFEEWMVNQELLVEGETFIITNVVSSTDARVDTSWTGASGNYTIEIINRYIDLPADCTTVLAVARRTDALTPTQPGLLAALSRYEDEWENLPLGEVNLPSLWVDHDPAFISAPRANFSLGTAATTGAGVRTLEFTSTFIRGGRESSHGEITKLTLSDTQNPVLTPYVGVANDGLLKRYYFRCPDLGYNAWRLLSDPTGGATAEMELEPTDVTARTYTGLTSTVLKGGEALFSRERFADGDGMVQRIRLYPRQDQDYVFTVRYMRNHTPMVEDGDVSSVPADQRMVIAYFALADVLMKHNNAPQAELYRRRADQALLRIERRYLITPSRRIVKGNWLANMAPNGYSRFQTLVHT